MSLLVLLVGIGSLCVVACTIAALAKWSYERSPFTAHEDRERLGAPSALPNICANRLSATASQSAQGTQPPHSGCGIGSACLGHRNCADIHCPGRPQ